MGLSPYQVEKPRARFEVMRAQMEQERSTWWYHWRELDDFYMPRKGRFFIFDVNKGNRRSQRIIDPTGTLSLNRLACGMMAYNTNPASEWFQFVPSDPGLRENSRVRDWADQVRDIISHIFLSTNFYDSLLQVYKDLALFGTAAMSIEEDFEKGIFTRTFPAGSYMLANDDKLKVRVFMRNFMMTVRQVVDQFGRKENGEIDWSNISDRCKWLWNSNHFESWVEITHVICPNDEFRYEKRQSRYKRFRSTYYERGVVPTGGVGSLPPTGALDNKFLSDSGFDYFPVIAPRWEVTGEDVYGSKCPGMIALGDVKQLQLSERRGLQAIEKMVNPPLIGPASLRNQRVSQQSGDLTYLDQMSAEAVLRPLHDVKFDVEALEKKQEQVRNRIKETFFIQELQAFLNSDEERSEPITAAEVAERKSEKLIALGDITWRVQGECLEPAVMNTFRIASRQGRIPPPPQELLANGGAFKLEYTSILAQAQKALSLGGIDRTTQYVMQFAETHPEALDVFDFDEAIREVADKTGAPAKILLDQDKVDAIRQQRHQQAAKQQQLEAAETASKAAKNLGGTPMGGDQPNALDALLQAGTPGVAA